MQSAYRNLYIISISGLALTACGGGGSDNQMNLGMDDQAKPLGQYTTIIGEAKNGDLMTLTTDEGKTFNLNTSTPGVVLNYGETEQHVNAQVGGRIYKNFTVSGHNYQSSKFGFIEDDALGDKGILFSHGYLTQDMPQQGSATYIGRSIFVDKYNTAIVGASYLSADFLNKQINGHFSGSERDRYSDKLIEYDIQFNGKINGNTFTGRDADAKTSVNGRFYGGNANEVGGIFENKTEQTKGSFGGVRQK